ncbi:unnamed protein product [Peronospora destructor]|uniref:C3H1-type domain-containing protein n=1 Tax=Peronospora destructor TaxID=86335 RepID=A0AAV0TFR7_9STRA|nr:unnamed protein product [Peronospora destructor]
MAIASGSSAESQHKPAPLNATSKASVSTEQQQMAPTPGTSELLDRVVTEFSQAFQSSLVQVVSDIRRDYGVDVEPDSKFAWMEKGGAAVAPGDEQLPRNDDGDSDDVYRVLRELQLSRLQVRQLQQVVDGLREEQRLLKKRVVLFGTLSAKLKRDLVDERLALIDAKNEIKELQQRRSRDDTGSDDEVGRSPQSPLLQEKQSDNVWNSPNKPIAGSADGASGPGTAGDGPKGPNLMGFDFYPSTSSRDAGDQEVNDDDSPSTSSSTRTLGSTLIGQFLPSALLDSPQLTPKHARPFAVDTLSEEKVSPSMFQLKDDIKSLSLAALPTGSTVNQQCTYDGTGDETKETSQADRGRVSTLSAVSALKVSMLSELFDAIPIEELEMILRRFDGLESAAIDNILSSHPSLNPAVGAGRRVESGALMALPLPSRSSSVGHSKTSLHRSSQSGPSGPPSGSLSNWKTEICMYYMQGKCNKTRRTCSFAHGESDLVRSSGSSLGGSISKHGPTYKTRLCQSYENGICTKPRRDCAMAHGVNDLRDGASASGVGGGSQPILLPAAPRLQSYKTELCYYFLKGNCNYSREECRFAHGQNDLRTVESNTAQIAAASSSSSFGEDFGPTSSIPPPPAVSMEKQLQLQHQYQQQYQQHHQPSSMISFQPQPPHPAQQPSFVPQHQIQLQHSSRGVGEVGHHQFSFQPQQYDLAQQQQQYMPPPSQYRYLRNMEDKRSTSVGRPPRRDSGSSWSSFDATGLPPSEY